MENRGDDDSSGPDVFLSTLHVLIHLHEIGTVSISFLQKSKLRHRG